MSDVTYLRGFKEHHDFFCRESRKYIASGGYGKLLTFNPWHDFYDKRYRWREVAGWPIAYAGFMWVSRKEIFKRN